MPLLNENNSYLNELIGAGADAMENLFYVEFISDLVDDKNGYESVYLTARTTDIKLPEFEQPTNPVNFLTVSADLPKAEVSGEKKITISFRLDSEYKLYKFLLNQQRKTSIPNLGYAATVTPEEKEKAGLTINIYSIQQEVFEESQMTPEVTNGFTPGTTYTKMYSFKYCWIQNINPPVFSYDSANSQVTSCDIYFYDWEDPQNLLLNK